MLRWRSFARMTIGCGLATFALSAGAASFSLAFSSGPNLSGEAFRLAAWAVGLIVGFLGLIALIVKLIINPIIERSHASNKEWLAERVAENKEWLREAIGELGNGFDGLMQRHADAADPHPSASDRMHEPLREADEKILAALEDLRRLREADAKRLMKLVAAHNAAVKGQQQAIDAIGCMAHRDPARSPFVRRATDPPEFDATSPRIRGHVIHNDAIVDEEEDPE